MFQFKLDFGPRRPCMYLIVDCFGIGRASEDGIWRNDGVGKQHWSVLATEGICYAFAKKIESSPEYLFSHCSGTNQLAEVTVTTNQHKRKGGISTVMNKFRLDLSDTKCPLDSSPPFFFSFSRFVSLRKKERTNERKKEKKKLQTIIPRPRLKSQSQKPADKTMLPLKGRHPRQTKFCTGPRMFKAPTLPFIHPPVPTLQPSPSLRIKSPNVHHPLFVHDLIRPSIRPQPFPKPKSRSVQTSRWDQTR